jgi:hypothetical protein
MRYYTRSEKTAETHCIIVLLGLLIMLFLGGLGGGAPQQEFSLDVHSVFSLCTLAKALEY